MCILSFYISILLQKVLYHWRISEKHSNSILLVDYENISFWAHLKIDSIKADFSQNFIISYTPQTLYSKVVLDQLAHNGTPKMSKNGGAE